MVNEILSDYTYFYYALIICGAIGVFAAIFRNPIQKIMEETEEKSNGRAAH
ncbi:MAG: hypothetical protein ACOY46_06220 [Bacillota bacterium]